MLATHKLKTLEELVRSSTAEELIWINGYLSGLVADKSNLSDPPVAVRWANVPVRKATICYGTETGNAQKLALQLTRLAKQHGITVQCKGLDQVRVEDLHLETDFFVVVSTQGEGEPPEPAKKFFEQLMKAQPDLSALHFGILALGDTAYPLFCKAGEDLDARLESLGAKRVVALKKCDVDYEAPAAEWFQSVIARYERQEKPPVAAAHNEPAREKHAGKKYYDGVIAHHINLNDRGSAKQTYHIEIRTQEPIDYTPGDAIAIVPENRPALVDRILALAGVDGSLPCETAKGKFPARELLHRHLNICHLLSSTIKKYAALTGHAIPDMRMDLADLLRIYPLKDADQFREMLGMLPGIAPRLYSVASSPKLQDKEVHILVGKHRFYAQGDEQFGLCSSFLGDLTAGSPIRFYVHRNRAFKLPDEATDIIMIGPGTGIAPFRSFLADRDAGGAAGKHWFFFGEQHFRTDFLYQAEMQQYLQTGVLQKLSLAFSRDQSKKIYVQHRMQEEAAEFFRWMESGAHIYISGTKDPMSREVEQAILGIIAEQGNRSDTEAATYLETMKKEGRYQKDVY
jgi:sulfite reductase (NADPH) flavoprotein alpha-component